MALLLDIGGNFNYSNSVEIYLGYTELHFYILKFEKKFSIMYSNTNSVTVLQWVCGEIFLGHDFRELYIYYYRVQLQFSRLISTTVGLACGDNKCWAFWYGGTGPVFSLGGQAHAICDSFAKFNDIAVISAIVILHVCHLVLQFHGCGFSLNRSYRVMRRAVVTWRLWSILGSSCFRFPFSTSDWQSLQDMSVLIITSIRKCYFQLTEARCSYKGLFDRYRLSCDY